jgi:hypothetical protein
MNTLSSVAIARISGTCIVVIAVNISIDAFSRASITRNSLAVFLFANNRSEDTVSVGARINCAQVVVVTNFLGILASFYGIARSDGTFVSIIARDRGMLNSEFNSAEITSTCIVVIKLNRRQWGVLATRNWVTRINSARVMVITVNRSVDAFFLVIRASVDGTNVVVITMRSSNIGKDTSGCRIARIISANVLIITNNCVVMDVSVSCITIIGGAFVVIINIDWSVDAFSASLITNIGCAWVMIVTNNRSFHNSGVAVTSNMKTRIAVIKRNCNVLATKFYIARISGASIVVITRNWGVLASKFLIARIKSTNVVVITVDCNMLASLFFVASVSGTCILVITNNRRIDATSCWVAVIISTCIVVIAINCNVEDFSSNNVTLFSGTFVVIAKCFRSKDTSSNFVTSVISARIVIATSYSGVDTSFNSIARIGGASIVIIAIKDRVLASKSWAARINCTCISIVTVFLFRVVTNSIHALVNGAKIVISALNTSVDALVGLCIASINSARVTIITIIDSRL